MNAIWKFPLPVSDVPRCIDIPQGARIIHCAAQNDIPCLWAQVDTKAPIVRREVRLIPTGAEITGVTFKAFSFLGTVHLDGGKYVLHVFLEKEVVL